MRSNAVAFRGTKQVVGAYVANDMPSWAICNGKPADIMFAYEGDDIEEGSALLEETLKRMCTGSSTAAYTFRAYQLNKGSKILSNTPHNRAFSFKLYEDEGEDYSPFEAGRRHSEREAEEKIAALQSQIDVLKKQIEEDEDEDNPGGVQGFLSGIMEDPTMKQVLVRALAGIVSKVVPMGEPMQPASVAGVGDTGQLVSVLQPGQPEKVQQAINVLCAKDPELGDHLLKLAAIAMNNPNQFNMLIGMLSSF